MKPQKEDLEESAAANEIQKNTLSKKRTPLKTRRVIKKERF